MRPASEMVALNAVSVLRAAAEIIDLFRKAPGATALPVYKASAKTGEACRDVAETLARRLELDFEDQRAGKDRTIYIASEHLVAEFRRLEIFGFQASGLALAQESTSGLGNSLAGELIAFRKLIEGAKT